MSTSPIETKKKKEEEQSPPAVPPPALPPVETLLSQDQAHELWEVLQDEPLTGKSVLIPLGKYAFLPGRLQPRRRRRGGANDSSDGRSGGKDGTETQEDEQEQQQQQQTEEEEEEEEELVTIHNGSTTIDITRSKAQEWLRPGSVARHPNHNTKAEPASTTQSRPSSLRHSTTTPPPPVPQAAAPPLVDIQEEYDANGNPVRANVVDMNQRLASLWNLGRDVEDQEETKMDPTINWIDTILQPSTRHPPPSSSSSSSSVQDEPPLKSLDDEEYDRLARRLEELARLEEQESQPRQQQQQNGTGRKIRSGGGGGAMNRSRGDPSQTTGAKGLQGGGWKKGFLTSPATTTAGSKKKKSLKTSPRGDDTATVASSTRKSSPSVQIDITQNQVHEIPRIGTQKVPPKQQQQQQQQPQQHMVSFEAPPTGATPPDGMEQEDQERPSLDPTVFSGVIQERQPIVKGRPIIAKHVASTSSSSSSSSSGQPPLPPLSSQSAPNSHDVVPSGIPLVRQQPTKQPPKRMSRFAKEQLEK